MKLRALLAQPTLWLVLGPVLALVAVVAVTRIGGGSPAEERAARATTTTIEAGSTTTTEPGGAGAVAGAGGGAPAEVLGAQEDAAFSEGESLTGAGFDDGAATDALGGSFNNLDFTTPPPAPETPPTTSPPPTSTTTTSTTSTTTTSTTSTSTTSTTTTSTTTSTTTTTIPVVPVQSRTITLLLSCTVTTKSAPDNPSPPVPATAILGISTLTNVVTNTNLPVLVGLLGPPNLLGEAGRDDLVQKVRLTALGSGSSTLQLQTTNPLPIAAGAPVLVPDGSDDFLAGTFAVTQPVGGSVVVGFDSVIFTRTDDGELAEQRCTVAEGSTSQLTTHNIVAPGATPTTSIPLPEPVVSESPFTALLPISAFVVLGGLLTLLVRRRRIGLTSRGDAR